MSEVRKSSEFLAWNEKAMDYDGAVWFEISDLWLLITEFATSACSFD